MSLRLVPCLLVTVLLFPVDGRTREVFPVPVFVTHLQVEPQPPLPPEQHQGIIGAARDKWLQVFDQLKKQHGNKSGNWPPEARKLLTEAEDARTLAVARMNYQAPDTRVGLTASVEDFIRDTGGGKNKELDVVTNAEDAALVVQVTGRRSKQSASVSDPRYFIRFRLRPGAKISGAHFLELTRDYDWNTYFAQVIAHPTDASGYVDLEASSPVSWKNAAGSVRAILLHFVRARLAPAKKG